MDEDAYVIGLLLVLVVLSAIPVLSTGITWFSLLLLLIVWSGVIAKKAPLGANITGGNSAPL